MVLWNSWTIKTTDMNRSPIGGLQDGLGHLGYGANPIRTESAEQIFNCIQDI